MARDDAVGEEVVMRRDGDYAMVKRRGQHVAAAIRCDIWARRVQLLLTYHDKRYSGLSGCIEVNFSLR